MVPRTRLLLWTALIVLPFATLAGTVPGALLPSVGILGLFLALVVVDAVLGSGHVRTLRVELPALVRLQKDRSGALEILIHNSSKTARLVRLALAFPATITAPEEERLVQLPGGTEEARLTWSCRPAKRGQYTLQHAYLETRSPLGFWAFRRHQAVACELRVYPNLEDERRQVAALFLRRGRVGVHTQRSAGTGREFEKLRDYIPGDNLSDIHWKASARRQHLISKVYQVERTHEVYVVVDTSRLSPARSQCRG